MKKINCYKGKRKDNGCWVEGYLASFDLIAPEYPESVANTKGQGHRQEAYVRFIEVDPNTVSRCIGSEDINNMLMFENDIVRCIYDGKESVYVIVWDQDEHDFKATNGEDNYGKNFHYIGSCDEIEVIGNIFDNPDLIKETKITKKFAGMRERSKINAIMEEKGMDIDKSMLEAGSDFITYKGMFADQLLTIMLNVFNGTFFVYNADGKLIATHSSVELDSTSWYLELLNIIYIDEVPNLK